AVEVGAEGHRDRVDRARFVDREVGLSTYRWLCEAVQCDCEQVSRRPNLRPRAHDLGFGNGVRTSARGGVEQRFEVDLVELIPSLNGRMTERALPNFSFRKKQRACDEGQSARYKPGVPLQESLPGVECRFKDLFLERLVADDLAHKKVS